MFKLLITQDYHQFIASVEFTGAYTGHGQVIWDERVDGPLQVDPGGWVRSGDSVSYDEVAAAAHNNVLIARAKASKLADLHAAYETANYADIDHADKTWKADRDSQQLLATVLSVGSVPPGMYWRDVTETQNPMTYADLQALAAAILERGLLLDSNLDTKKAAVEAATTAEEVNAITW